MLWPALANGLSEVGPVPWGSSLFCVGGENDVSSAITEKALLHLRRSRDLAHASIPLAQTPWGLTGRAWLQAGAQQAVIAVDPSFKSLGIDSRNVPSHSLIPVFPVAGWTQWYSCSASCGACGSQSRFYIDNIDIGRSLYEAGMYVFIAVESITRNIHWFRAVFELELFHFT